MRFYTTCPPSSAYAAADYAARVAQVSRWSEEAGAEGMLIYTDNGLADPWTVAGTVLAQTERLVPLVAVQPVYHSPYAIAKTIASLALLHGRRVALNMVAGGFVRDLAALGDVTEHDDRYARLEEYTTLILALLRGQRVEVEGRWYSLGGVELRPEMPNGLLPEVFLSGSSEAGIATGLSLGATPVCYPPPPDRIEGPAIPGRIARIGLIARNTDDEAWALAHGRFPADPRGAMTHKLAMATSDSVWHRQLADLGATLKGEAQAAYWLHPMETYRTFCPYLVGSHDRIAAMLSQYAALGFEGLILDVPATQDDLEHTAKVLELAERTPVPA